MKVKMDFWERIMIPERIRIPVLGGVIYKLLSNLARKKIKRIQYEDLNLNKEKRNQILTCTLTTFPDRIDSVHYTIKSLFNQSVKPDRIVLWLAEEEFCGKEFPDSIKELQKRGLEIRYCDNLFGHKRYYKLLDEQKDNELLIMFDDDIIFPYYMIERLYDKWKEYPDAIICDRGQLLTFDGNEVLNPGRWSSISDVGIDSPSYRILVSGGGGCLVPPKSLYKDVCVPEKIKEYALRVDDLWLMFMAVQNNTKILRTYKYHRTFISSENQQTVQLGKEAIYNGGYIRTFQALIEAYPHAYNNMLLEINNSNAE